MTPSVHAIEYPDRMVTTKETVSVYYAFNEGKRFYFCFDVDILPTFFICSIVRNFPYSAQISVYIITVKDLIIMTN